MTKGERKLCDFMYKKSGGFYTSLWEAILKADRNNLFLIGMGFPEEVEAYTKYSGIDGYWDKLETEYLNSTPVKPFNEMPMEC